MSDSKSQPSVSILVPAYKCERYLRACVDSVLAQSMPDWELVIVNDGSPDEATPRLVDEMAALDRRIRCFHQSNSGTAAARRKAYSNSDKNSKYLLFLDNDDALEPDALETMQDALESSPEASAVSCQDRYIDENGDPKSIAAPSDRRHYRYIATRSEGFRKLDADEPDTAASLATWNGIRTPGCVLIRRSAFEKAGNAIRTDLPFASDWAMWLALSKVGPILRIDKPLLLYRLHDSNMSSDLPTMRNEVHAVRREVLASKEYTADEKFACVAGYKAIESDGVRDKIAVLSADLKQGHIGSALRQIRYLAAHTARYLRGRP